MIAKSRIQVAVMIAVVVWAVLLLAEGVPLKGSYLRPYSAAVAVVFLAQLLYDRWLWRLPVARRFTHRPDVQGTWAGVLRSSWVNPATGKGVKPINVYLAITQTESALGLRLLTPESASESVASSLSIGSNGGPSVIWTTYVNTPDLPIQERSRPHHGAMQLEVHAMPDGLKGKYWTDRKTTGEILLDRRTRQIHTSFGSAVLDPHLTCRS